MNNTGSILYCIQCGTYLNHEEKFGRVRPVCPACGWIYFTDPKVAAAVVLMKGNQVLLTRRTNPPYQGYWSLPAGFMDASEDPGEAAKRECFEETGLEVKIGNLLNVISGREHEHGADLVLIYEAELIGGILQAGDDADRAEFFPLDSLPPLAFRATQSTLKNLDIQKKSVRK
jgi:8-oxo-dGTP diphosphatase